MIRKNMLKIILSSVVTLIPMVIGLALWEKLPTDMATSFGFHGEVTDYSNKGFAVIGLPMILLACNLFFLVVIANDPKRKNIGDKVFGAILCLIPICSLFSGALIYKDALGLQIRVEAVTPVFMGLLFFVIGLLLPKCKQNYTVGIKIPWTLHSEDNWDKTHTFAGKLWTIGGLFMIGTGLLGLMYLTLAGMGVLIVVPMIYSYVYYRRHEYQK